MFHTIWEFVQSADLTTQSADEAIYTAFTTHIQYIPPGCFNYGDSYTMCNKYTQAWHENAPLGCLRICISRTTLVPRGTWWCHSVELRSVCRMHVRSCTHTRHCATATEAWPQHLA